MAQRIRKAAVRLAIRRAFVMEAKARLEEEGKRSSDKFDQLLHAPGESPRDLMTNWRRGSSASNLSRGASSTNVFAGAPTADGDAPSLAASALEELLELTRNQKAELERQAAVQRESQQALRKLSAAVERLEGRLEGASGTEGGDARRVCIADPPSAAAVSPTTANA